MTLSMSMSISLCTCSTAKEVRRSCSIVVLNYVLRRRGKENDLSVVAVLAGNETTKLCGTRSLFDMVVSIADQFEIQSTIPRRTGRQINRAGHPADNPSQFWQRSMYYPFMDYYITELTARLLENGGRYQAQYLIPINLPGRFVPKLTD
jgi:hypothetical protein